MMYNYAACRDYFTSIGIPTDSQSDTSFQNMCNAIIAALNKPFEAVKEAVKTEAPVALKNTVMIYTDGACSGNPGPGGWGAVLMIGDHKKEISGSELETTNNRMELLAAIKGLGALKKKCDVMLYSDSAYLVRAFNEGWLAGWIKNDWRKSNKEPVENRDLWERLYNLVSAHNVTFVKVKGHADNEFNNRCDALAVAAYKTLLQEAVNA